MIVTDVTELFEADRSDFDETDLLNMGYVRELDRAIRDRERDSYIIPRQRCAGCWAPRDLVDRYCGGCGVDFRWVGYGLLTTAFPPFINRELRSEWSRERAKAIRKLLAALGLKEMSVTCGRGTASHLISVTIPSDKHWTARDSEPVDEQGYHDMRHCPRCAISGLAQTKLTEIILAAFPDLDDRSDLMSDYYDFVFSVNSR